MKSLTDIVVALIEMMEGEEQDAFLATLAQGKRPTKPLRPLTDAEQWWHDKLGLRHGKDWLTEITSSDLVDDFIKRTGWTKSRHGAATSMGGMLKKVCPDIRRYDGKYLIPGNKQSRRAFLDAFPGHRGSGRGADGPGEESGDTLVVDGKTVKVLKTTAID